MLTVADLIVKIRADVTGVQAGMMKTSASIKGIERDAEAAGGKWTRFSQTMSKGWLVSAGVLGVAGMGVKKGIDDLNQYGAAIKKVHDLTGMTAKDSSYLAAQLVGTGVPAETAGMSMKFFEKAMYGARKEGSAQAAMFADLGIKVKDVNGKWLDTSQVLFATRDKLSQLGDTTKKTTYMTALFGRGAQSMTPWLAKSSAQIQEMNKAAEKMGVIWDDKKLEQYKKFAASQHRLGLEIKGVGVQLGMSLVPVLEKMTKVLEIVVGLFTKIPGPIKALGVAAIVCAAALSVTMKAVSFLTGGFRTLMGTEAKTAAATTAETEATVANTAAQKEAGVASGKLSGLLKSQALQWMAVAAAAMWTWSKVTQAYHAWQEMDRAQTIMMSNMQGLQSTINTDAARLGKEGYSQAQQALIMGSAGSTTAGLQAIQAMGKGGAVGVPGTTLNINVGTVVGTDQKAAQQFAAQVGNHIMRNVTAIAGGGNG